MYINLKLDGSYSVNNESGQILGTLTEKATDPNWDMIYNCSNGLCEGKILNIIK